MTVPRPRARVNIADRIVDDGGRPTFAFHSFLREIEVIRAKLAELETRIEALEP